jgi:membrane-associated phospholipid phosphatase
MIIYFAYPAAPPWWVYQNGLTQPTLQHSMPAAEAGSVPVELFHFSANRFAAIPSLHAAYPLLLTLVLAAHRARSRSVALASLYTLAMWFSCVFLNQHYIIDLIIGAMLLPLAIPAARRPPDHLMEVARE